MSKFTVVIYAALLFSLTIAPAYATLIEEILQIQINAQNADFSAATDSADWSRGASAWGLSKNNNFFSTNDATVSATFTGNNDLSDGSGLAESTYSAGNFTITLNNWQIYDAGTLSFIEVGDIVLTGTLAIDELLSEVETEVNSDLLKVSGIVTIDSFTFTPVASSPVELKWIDDMGEKGAMIGEILLPTGTNITDYSTDYNTGNLTLTIYADENNVPEPVSVSLLSLGALALIRRRKA